MILPTFVEDQKETLWSRLSNFFNNSDVKMTADRYFELCEQMNKKPKEEEIPVSWEDLPLIVQEAVNCFNVLGDRIEADIGYLGKDYTALSAFTKEYDIEERMLFIEVLAWLDSRAIKKSAEKMKQEHDKLKRKHSG